MTRQHTRGDESDANHRDTGGSTDVDGSGRLWHRRCYGRTAGIADHRSGRRLAGANYEADRRATKRAGDHTVRDTDRQADAEPYRDASALRHA